MTRMLIAILATLALAIPAAMGSVPPDDAPEGCVALNPAQPTCSYKAAEAVDTFGGAAGRGNWIVKVKVGKKTTTYKSPASGEPYGTQFMVPAGATVTASATSAGSGVIVGGE